MFSRFSHLIIFLLTRSRITRHRAFLFMFDLRAPLPQLKEIQAKDPQNIPAENNSHLNICLNNSRFYNACCFTIQLKYAEQYFFIPNKYWFNSGLGIFKIKISV